MQEKKNVLRCNWCGQYTTLIWIHGHGQCASCGTNIDECCRGENVQEDKSESVK